VRHLSSMANFRNPVDITTVMFFRKEKWRVYRMNSIVHSTISETIFPFHRNKMNKYGKRNIEAKVVSFTKRNIFCLSILKVSTSFLSVSFSPDGKFKQSRWLRQSEKDFPFFSLAFPVLFLPVDISPLEKEWSQRDWNWKQLEEATSGQ